MTNSSHHRIPEPSFPEHDLIQAADQLPELSSGLRSSTLVACDQQIRHVRRINRLRYTAVGVLALTFVLGVGAMMSISAESPASAVVEEPIAASTETPLPLNSPGTRSPGESPPSSGTMMSIGNSNSSTELEGIDRKIEALQR